MIDEVLGHAVDVMTESGVAGLTVSEAARRAGMRGPSLYKYFPSLHALYDALFARGMRGLGAAVDAAVDAEPPGVPRLRIGGRAIVRWCVENPALAQLMFWRVVPGVERSPETFAAWRYRLKAEGTGTRVVESYEVTRPITPFGWFIIGGIAGCKDRRGDLARGMQQTLERLKAVVEAPTSASRPA